MLTLYELTQAFCIPTKQKYNHTLHTVRCQEPMNKYMLLQVLVIFKPLHKFATLKISFTCIVFTILPYII